MPETFNSHRDFTRSGPLSPDLVTVLILYMVSDAGRRGYAHLLRGFWDEAAAHGIPLPCVEPVSAASFCEARQKITPTFFRELLYQVAAAVRPHDDPARRLWKGRRVFAADGTKLNLQRGDELAYAFGVPSGSHCPQALLSVLVDVCTRTPVDLEISGYATSERAHLYRMLESLEKGDVLVLDRGYPSHELLHYLCEARIEFLIRVPASHSFKAIDLLRADGCNDREVMLESPEHSPSEWAPLHVRLVSIEGPDEKTAYFISSLSAQDASRDEIAGLYRLRWEAEEFFKLLKSEYVGQRQFRSKSASGIRQEIHAIVLLLALTRVSMSSALEQHPTEPNVQLSQKGAYLALSNFLTRILLHADDDARLRAMTALIERIARSRERRRPNRSFARCSFRPGPRWGPGGRRGA